MKLKIYEDEWILCTMTYYKSYYIFYNEPHCVGRVQYLDYVYNKEQFGMKIMVKHVKLYLNFVYLKVDP